MVAKRLSQRTKPKKSHRACHKAQPSMARLDGSRHKRKQNLDSPWGQELRKVHQILDSLEPPFLSKVTANSGLLSMGPLWVFPSHSALQGFKATDFFDDPSWQSRWQEIVQHLWRFKENPTLRNQIWALLRQCDASTRATVTMFNDLIKTYEKWLSQEISQVGALPKALGASSIFPLPIDLVRVTATHCGNVGEKIGRAFEILEQAHEHLRPASEFFLNRKAPSKSAVKAKLMNLLINKGMMKKNPAATLAALLLNLADPSRPVKKDALRHFAYKRPSLPKTS